MVRAMRTNGWQRTKLGAIALLMTGLMLIVLWKILTMAENFTSDAGSDLLYLAARLETVSSYERLILH